MNRNVRHSGATLLLLGLGLGLTAWLAGRHVLVLPRVATGQVLSPTPTPVEPEPTDSPELYEVDPVYDAQQAIDRALEDFPEGEPHTDELAILTRYADLDMWRSASSPDTWPHSPVWLVGLRASSLERHEVIVLPDPDGDGPGPAYPVEGAFYAFDAQSGDLVGYGVLDPATTMHWNSLAAVPQHAFVIVTATPIPVATPPPGGGEEK